MIVAIIVILLILSIMDDACKAREWEDAQYNAELRNLELIEAIEKSKEVTIVPKKKQKITHRSFFEDAKGTRLMEEIIAENEEYL